MTFSVTPFHQKIGCDHDEKRLHAFKAIAMMLIRAHHTLHHYQEVYTTLELAARISDEQNIINEHWRINVNQSNPLVETTEDMFRRLHVVKSLGLPRPAQLCFLAAQDSIKVLELNQLTTSPNWTKPDACENHIFICTLTVSDMTLCFQIILTHLNSLFKNLFHS